MLYCVVIWIGFLTPAGLLAAQHKEYINTFRFLWPFLSRLQQTASTSSPMEDRTASCSAFIVKIFCSNLTTLDWDARLCWREASWTGLKTVWWLQDSRSIITAYIDQNCQAWTLGTLHFPLRNSFFLLRCTVDGFRVSARTQPNQ